MSSMARESSVTNGSAAPERKRSTRPWRSCSTKRKTTRRSRHGDGGGVTPETQQQATFPAPHPGHNKFNSRPVAPRFLSLQVRRRFDGRLIAWGCWPFAERVEFKLLPVQPGPASATCRNSLLANEEV